MRRQEEILKEMAGITAMARGRLCVMRRAKSGRVYYSRQTWRDGRNVTEYVPRDKAEKLKAATEAYARFMALVEEYVDIVEGETMKG